MTQYKGQRNNLVISSSFQKDPIHQRETFKPHVSKPFYTGSDNYFTGCSNDEENIKNYKLMYELSHEDKKDSEGSEESNTHFKAFMKINFQNNIIWYTLTNIMVVDEKINEAKKYGVTINKSDKWGLSNSITLQYLLSAYHFLTFLYMSSKMVMNKKGKKPIYPFQVGYMLNLN